MTVSAIPLGTLGVNVIGSFLIGLMWVYLQAKMQGNEWPRLLLIVGVLGGFTTFSAFSLETMQLIQNSQWFAALANAAANLLACLLAVVAGLMLGKVVVG